jgi:hypothetical protein
VNRFAKVAPIPVLVGVALAALQGCDPCLGVVACRGDARPGVQGRLLTPESGEGVSGAAITLIRSNSGVRDSAQTTTDRSGVFSLVIAEPARPADNLSLRVKPVEAPGYTIDSLPCAPLVRRGDACILNPIIESPKLPLYRFFYRSNPDVPAGGVWVSFRRTGGSGLIGPNAADSIRVGTTQDGSADLFSQGVFATSLEPVVGDLIVELPPPTGISIRYNYKARPLYTFQDAAIGYLLTGPCLNYWVVFVDSVTQRRLPGVEVEFQRTGGIATKTESVKKVSNTDGLTDFLPGPLTSGAVNGSLRIRPPNAAVAIDLGPISATTYDADSAIVFGKWSVGATGKLYPLPREGKP